jgi:polyphosphate kinase
MINAERDAALTGKKARIVAKMNAITDPDIIKALYGASRAGVKIELIIRGICCLRPGMAGVSENIRVISVIGRFLEHSRVYYFQNSDPQVYCSSADWMERNLNNRIEVCFPILKKKHISRVKAELEMYLNDRGQSWELNSTGEYLSLESASPSGESLEDVQMLLLKQWS